MKTFQPENSQSDVDFLAYSVAKMEIENSGISALSVAGSMPPAMADTFYRRLHFYRQQLDHNNGIWKEVV